MTLGRPGARDGLERCRLRSCIYKDKLGERFHARKSTIGRIRRRWAMLREVIESTVLSRRQVACLQILNLSVAAEIFLRYQFLFLFYFFSLKDTCSIRRDHIVTASEVWPPFDEHDMTEFVISHGLIWQASGPLTRLLVYLFCFVVE